jgi:hypothetical protein
MSIRVQSLVWDKATKYEGGELLVLLALADWADDQGLCWPSVPAIAFKARLTERQVYRILRMLRDDGVITGESTGGRGKRTVYRIQTTMLVAPKADINPDKMSGFPLKQNPDICDTKTLTFATRNPDICDKSPRPPNRKNHQEPPEKQPSIKTHLSPTPFRNRKGECGDPAIAKLVAEISDRCKFVSKRVKRAMAEVLAMERSSEISLAATADLMESNWEIYRQQLEVMRFSWGPVKFFSEGHWRDSATWPYDDEQVKAWRRARQGF